MKEMEENSIDSIVTDPPYELGFMGKSWDATGIANSVEMWSEALRVLKPGGHLLAFSGSRTYHRMAVAIEDAGFEIRDQIMWIYGSGFPKSHDVSKGIDKRAGAEREVVKTGFAYGISVGQEAQGYRPADYVSKQLSNEAITTEAKQWQGWGTALKPAHEPIVVARKPLIGTVAANVLTYRTGGLNIDGARVGRAEGDDSVAGSRTATFRTQETASGGDGSGGWEQNTGGRWPANVIHDGSDEVVELFPDTKTGSIKPYKHNNASTIYGGGKGLQLGEITGNHTGDSGSAARFFYCAKASKRDRNEGLDGFEVKRKVFMATKNGTGEPSKGLERFTTEPSANHHPTVKPTELMRYLCRLVTPPGGIVLDPFMGSGSTGKAAMYEGFEFVGIELQPEYVEIAIARIEFAKKEKEQQLL
jgi:site-specific DNA-methyltransferase (adenine-specific)